MTTTFETGTETTVETKQTVITVEDQDALRALPTGTVIRLRHDNLTLVKHEDDYFQWSHHGSPYGKVVFEQIEDGGGWLPATIDNPEILGDFYAIGSKVEIVADTFGAADDKDADPFRQGQVVTIEAVAKGEYFLCRAEGGSFCPMLPEELAVPVPVFGDTVRIVRAVGADLGAVGTLVPRHEANLAHDSAYGDHAFAVRVARDYGASFTYLVQEVELVERYSPVEEAEAALDEDESEAPFEVGTRVRVLRDPALSENSKRGIHLYYDNFLPGDEAVVVEGGYETDCYGYVTNVEFADGETRYVTTGQVAVVEDGPTFEPPFAVGDRVQVVDTIYLIGAPNGSTGTVDRVNWRYENAICYGIVLDGGDGFAWSFIECADQSRLVAFVDEVDDDPTVPVILDREALDALPNGSLVVIGDPAAAAVRSAQKVADKWLRINAVEVAYQGLDGEVVYEFDCYLKHALDRGEPIFAVHIAG